MRDLLDIEESWKATTQTGQQAEIRRDKRFLSLPSSARVSALQCLYAGTPRAVLLHRTALTRTGSAARCFATGRQSLPVATTAAGAGVVNCLDVSETIALQPPRSDNLRLRRVKPRPPRPSV